MTDKNANQKLDEMVNFFKTHLENAESYEQRKTDIGSATDVNYLRRKDGLILLMNTLYTERQFWEIVDSARRQFGNNSAVVFHKDGKTYFRSALNPDGEVKIVRYRKTFKHYDDVSKYPDKPKQRMINFTEPEKLMQDAGKVLQYYQPDSGRLDEAIVSYVFDPAIYKRIVPPNKSGLYREEEASKKIFIWREPKTEYAGSLKLVNGILVPVQPAEQ